MYDRFAIPFVVGFFSAVALVSFFPLPISVSFLFGLLALVFLLLARRCRLIGIAFFCVGACFGVTRFFFTEPPRAASFAHFSVKQHVTGRIVEEPAVTQSDAKLVVELDNSKTTIQVTANRYPAYEYGDKISLIGKIEQPRNFSDFDWVGYLRFRGISAVMRYPEIELVSKNQGNPILSALLFGKHLFIEKVAAAIPEPAASFGNGVALGAKSALPKDLTDEFQRTSTSHLIAVSGYNLTFLASWIDWFLASAPLVLARWGSVFAIVGYVFMTGASGATVRAGIMALSLIVARHLGRPVHQFRLLMIASFFMVLYNPLVLAFDLSFQLSFLATSGMIFLTPLFEKPFARFVANELLLETIAGTLAAQTAVLPLILYKTGVLSLVALPVNALVLPFVPLAMFLVAFVGIGGVIWAPLGIVLGAPAYAVLTYMLSVIRAGASLPFAAVTMPFPLACMILAYGVLFAWVWLSDELAKPEQLTVSGTTFEIVELT